MTIALGVWLGVLVITAIVEIATTELVSVWFSVGAIPALILAACLGNYLWEVQLAVFVVVSAVCILGLRRVTKKWLYKNINEKTNLDALIGKQLRMLSRTDFETVGSVKVNDVVWSAIGEKDSTIEKGEIVEVVKVMGNKLVVKPIKDEGGEI